MSTRRPRTRPQPSYGDDPDSGSSGAEETPQPRGSKFKRRISDAFVPLNDEQETRTPLRPMSMNDDLAEKRKRRKSNKAAEPSLEIVNNSRAAGERGNNQLATIDDPPIFNVPLDVMSSNFEEWMKLATDNKINPTNSWNVALIDYFHDMSLLRMTDNSINFQKASCTLDGCVKIWTSRVESVGTETFKLVSDLASGGKDNDIVGPEDEDETGTDPAKKRNKAHRPEATLAKNASQLRNKKPDLEFLVDPLFKKTCADFDESGAQGLLMNHLSLGLGGSLRVVFDAGDSAGIGEEDGEDEPDEPEDVIDISHLRKEFLPTLDMLETKAISHSLENFSFQRDEFDFNDVTILDTADIQLDSQDGGSFAENSSITGDDHPMDFDGDNENANVEDFFVGEQAIQDDCGGDDFAEGDSGIFTTAEGNEAAARPIGAYEPFDPRRVPNERDLIMAMTNGDGEGGMMDYFDQNFLKNWAGPEHWKLRKQVRKVEPTEAPKARKERESKKSFKIDFTTPLEVDIKKLFAPATGRGPGIDLPSSKASTHTGKGTDKRQNQTLPGDMHFSSRQLVTLFLKPKFSLKMRGYQVKLNQADGEVDENFWAQAAANQAAGLQASDADETGDADAIPFNTQFFHDDYDDGPGFDDVYEGDAAGADIASAEDQDLLAATQGQSRRVRPEAVNYTKRAKRVDVRKLKENIWKNLNIVVSHGQKDDEGDVSMTSEPPTDPSEARVFENVVSGLQQSYPKEKMEEISTSFCFICLLHLANEQGLKIEVGSKNEDGEDPPEDQIVGDLRSLMVFRDPDATPAA